MKKILIYSVLILGIVSCKDKDIIFDDFDYSTVYFPYQLPLRTLSLGEDRVDNSADRNFQFDIGATIGGMYENNQDRMVDYVVDNTLTDNVYQIVSGDTIKINPLPGSYYTLNPTSTFIIPNGSFIGRVTVQLNEAFFDDPLAITGKYVVPLLITGTSADSILRGLPATGNVPDRRITSDWEAGKAPKDWVLFGVKYVNSYHGTYLQRGRDIIYSGTTPIDTVIYRNIHKEKDKVVILSTSGKTSAVTNFIGQNLSSTGSYAMNLQFSNMWGTPGGAITITPGVGSTIAVSGSGQFFDKENSVESIIGLTMQSMHLNYTYVDGDNNTHVVADTLVFRDRMLKFEQNSIKIVRDGVWYSR